jgi:hypothetical protein
MAVFAPIPSASESTAAAVKPGDLRSMRAAKRRSCNSPLILFHLKVARASRP